MDSNKQAQGVIFSRKLKLLYWSFIRPHLDYGDIIYDKAYNNSFHQNLEKIEYNSALATTRAIRGTSK